MKRSYSAPRLESVVIQDKDSVTMVTNQVKTLNVDFLDETCGFSDLTRTFPDLDPSVLTAQQFELFLPELGWELIDS